MAGDGDPGPCLVEVSRGNGGWNCKVQVITAVPRKRGKAASHIFVEGRVRYADAQMAAEIGEARLEEEALWQLQARSCELYGRGYTVAPDSAVLFELLGKVSEEELQNLLKPKKYVAQEIAQASITQLKQILHESSLVLGLFKARYRDGNTNSNTIHKDDVHITEEDVCIALFSGGGSPSRYQAFCEDAARAYPRLLLPRPACTQDFSDWPALTREVLDAIQHYNSTETWEDTLVFDNINVWIPRARKQLIFLPMRTSVGITYPFATKADALLMAHAAQGLETLDSRNALIFFGQCVLHQALIGPGFDLSGGSLEGRYLVLSPRRLTNTGALRVAIADSGERPEVSEPDTADTGNLF